MTPYHELMRIDDELKQLIELTDAIETRYRRHKGYFVTIADRLHDAQVGLRSAQGFVTEARQMEKDGRGAR